MIFMQKESQGRVANGIVWSAVERFSVQGIQFLLSIVIARLVLPSDYGLIAMLGIFLAVAQQFIDSGFSNALVQKKDRSDVDFSTVFYANLVIAVVVYALLYVSAPWIADFYDEPRLTTVTRWIGLTVVLMAFSIVQRAKLTIELDFKTQAKISLVSVITSGLCGVLLAWKGFGVWALVVQTLVNNFINSLLLWILACWKLQCVFSWTSFRSLFSFGSKLLAVGILHVLYSNIYTLIIGKKFSALDVGYFNRAQTLALFPSFHITSVICRVTYTEQCNLQNDNESLRVSLLRYQRFLAYLIFPVMMGMAVLSKPLIEVVLSERWIAAAEYLSILCIGYLWNPIWSSNLQIINVKGRSDLSLKIETYCKMVAVAILIISIPFGLKIMCWGLTLSGFIDVLIIIPYTKKLLQIGYRTMIKNLLPVVGLTLATVIVMWLPTLFFASAFSQTFVSVTFGILTYIILSILFRIREFEIIKSFFLK